ncbi:hypothetical protein HA402_015174 [Bradysia odoriphaga]|nr:hypothetical protein HA402_015174 [Bradysia odoriphaga]
MPSASENDSCLGDPNFAVICSFLQHYADILKIMNPTFKTLQEMIESKNEVARELVNTVMRLLYKCNISVDRERWERRLAKFCRTYSNDDADTILRLGFRNLKTNIKLRVIKELLEYQFEHNIEFKKIVNEMTPDKQRCKPLMEDDGGHLFWTMTDSNDDTVVYKENVKKKSWNVLAHDRHELTKLIKRNAPPSPPRRTSTRRSLVNATIRPSEPKAKDLLKELRLSIGRLKDVA